MFEFLKKFFIKSKNRSISYEENIKHNSITFSIDQLDKMKIDIVLQSDGVSYADTFGKLLYGINHAVYEDKILECLVSLSKSNPDLVPSIQRILTTWGIMIVSKETNTQKSSASIPFIKPTSVFHK